MISVCQLKLLRPLITPSLMENSWWGHRITTLQKQACCRWQQLELHYHDIYDDYLNFIQELWAGEFSAEITDAMQVKERLRDYWYSDCGQVKAATICQTSVTQLLTLLGFIPASVREGLTPCFSRHCTWSHLCNMQTSTKTHLKPLNSKILSDLISLICVKPKRKTEEKNNFIVNLLKKNYMWF